MNKKKIMFIIRDAVAAAELVLSLWLLFCVLCFDLAFDFLDGAVLDDVVESLVSSFSEVVVLPTLRRFRATIADK